MGLAASQARFLALTARKADCEYRSMQNAQEKLALTRRLAAATEQYENSLNLTKLVWDYNGTGEELRNVSYGLLMTPGALNNYTPYLLTDRANRVVVNSKYATALSDVVKQGTERNIGNFESFMNALFSNGIITQSTADTVIENAKRTDKSGTQFYQSNIGYGSTPLSKNEELSTNIIALKTKMLRKETMED